MPCDTGGEVVAVYAAVLRRLVPLMHQAVNARRYRLALAFCRRMWWPG